MGELEPLPSREYNSEVLRYSFLSLIVFNVVPRYNLGVKLEKQMARPGGNPDFGAKYRFDYGREEPLSEQVKVLVHPQTKRQLKNLASQRNCTVPDLVRAAIDQYLANEQTARTS